jgi:hypothetical protein
MGRLVRSLRRPVDAWDFGARSDWNLGAKDRINARYLYRDRLGEKDIANIGGYSSDFYTEYHNSGVSWIRLITPETTNEARFGFGRENVSWSGADGSPFSDIGRNIAVFSMPAGYLGYGTAANFPQDASSRSLEIQDNLSRQAGRHGLRVGGHYWRGNARVATRRLYNGQFQFDTFQDFIDNRPAAFTGAAGDLVTNLAAQSMSVYFQDDLRLTSNLTLNLGVRYEFATQPAASLHDFTLARESNPATALWDLSLPLSSRTVPLPPVDRNNWAPRVGFAWSPRFAPWMFGNEATVIRGGYSTSYELPYLFQSISVSGSAPVGKRYTLPGGRFVVPADVSGDNLRRLAEPAGGGDPRHQAQFQFAPDFHSPYAQTWSVGIQRRIGFSQAFEIRYAGSRGMDLFQTRNGNPNARAYVEAGFADVLPPGTLPGDNASCAQCSGRVDPEFSQIALLANTAASTYHALQTRYNGRIGNQLVLGASYTWSRSIDNASDLLAASPGAQLVEQMSQNPFDLTRGERGPSDFDLTHIGSSHFVWDTPWFREQQSFTGRLLGGWKIAGVQRWTSGRPVSAYQQNSLTPTVNDRDFNQNFLGSFDTTRAFSANPNAPQSSAAVVLPNGALVDRRQPTRAVSAGDVRWIYNNLSSARLFGTPFGSGRNVMRAPGFNQTDLALYKNFQASERVTVQLRFESTNSFNHPNLGPGAVFIEQPGFLNPSETEAEPRRIAVGLRILF